MRGAYIVDIIRTPIGKYGGALSSVRPDDLAASVLRGLLDRNANIPSTAIEDVILGAANQAGEDNRNVARMAALLAGLPVEVGGVTVNRLCASGLQAIMDASRAIALDEGTIYLAGGVESMSRAPYVMAKPESGFSRKVETYDTTIGWRFTNPNLAQEYYPYSMGETAENVAEKRNVSRKDQDLFAFGSQQKYFAAKEKNLFNDELTPISVPRKKAEPMLVTEDEHPRRSTLDQLAALKPAFRQNGTVTAGNSSGINDGAAACLLASEQALKDYELKPLARVVSMAVAGVDPAYMGLGPIPATKKALKRSNLSLQDLDLIELNEAFASQSIACIKDLDLDPAKINVNGGAISLGHPLGASGARISATLIHQLQRQSNARYGLATMCIGVGQGAAVIYEKC